MEFSWIVVQPIARILLIYAARYIRMRFVAGENSLAIGPNCENVFCEVFQFNSCTSTNFTEMKI